MFIELAVYTFPILLFNNDMLINWILIVNILQVRAYMLSYKGLYILQCV